MAIGRYAPSPTGELHLGNLRTAVVAWLLAREAGSDFLMRIEDLDPASRSGRFIDGQLADLRALGLDWDGELEPSRSVWTCTTKRSIAWSTTV